MVHIIHTDKPITAIIDNEIILIDEMYGNNFHMYASFIPNEDVMNIFPDGATAEKTDNTNISEATIEQNDILWNKIKNKGYEWDSENHRLKKSTLTIIQV